MIAYIESNFVLELALQQEEAAAAERILERAEKGGLDLAMPSFALSEPFSTLAYRRNERGRLVENLTRELKEIQRSVPHRMLVSDITKLLNDLRATWKSDQDALEQTTRRLLKVVRLIATNDAIFEEALRYIRKHSLYPADAIIFATVMADLAEKPRRQKKCFLSRDRKAFLSSDIRVELKLLGCRFIPSFENGLGFLGGKKP